MRRYARPAREHRLARSPSLGACGGWHTGQAASNTPPWRSAGDGWWQAQVPEANGETIVTRYTLRVLLDELDDLLGGQAAASTPP